MKYECHEQDLSGGDTRIITITSRVKDVPADMIKKINGGYVRFEMQAGTGAIFHFV